MPALTVGTTTACCSDQQVWSPVAWELICWLTFASKQPFFNAGYDAVAFNEGGGYTIDPQVIPLALAFSNLQCLTDDWVHQYHNIKDVVQRDDYSTEQVALITEAILATAATLAGPPSQ